MSKKKDSSLMAMQNQLVDPISTQTFSAELSTPRKHKKHKHKKHKRNKKDDDEDSGSPDAAGDGAKPSLKLKIKIGGQTLGEKSVIKTEIPDPDSEDSDDGSDEEDAWLQALESGRLEEVDDELRKMKDPTLMTARQRALLESKAQKEREEPVPPPAPAFAEKELTEEMIQRRLLRAKKRKQQAEEKKEKDKKQTIERLLKKTDAKVKGSKKISKKVDHPKITYISNTMSHLLCLPPGMDFPLSPKPRPIIPVQISCGVRGCKNPKKYSCSRSGVPLCSLACYKENLRLLKLSS